MNISDLLGAMMQSGMSPSSGDRMKNALGGGAAEASWRAFRGCWADSPSRGAAWDLF